MHSIPNELIPVFVVAGWLLVCFFLSRISGWAKLARFYKAAQPFPGRTYALRSGTLNSVQFRGALTLGAGPEGLFLNVLLLFRFGFAPLLIPWDDVAATVQTGRWFSTMELRFRQAPSVVLTISEGLGRDLYQAGGRRQ